MKFFIILFFICAAISVQAQDDVKFFSDKKDGGSILYAANAAYCPVSLILELKMTNMSFSNKGQKIFVIPALTDKYKIGDLDILKPTQKSNFSMSSNIIYGDVNLERYDTSYAYELPFQKGKEYLLSQGYNGAFSHKNENSLDFTMDVGTPLLAAREGVVVSVVQNNDKFCPKPECKKYSNYVTIYHSDGTFADYIHLKYNGAKVKIGNKVNAGDMIAYSGNTGWSSGPHLHFACSVPTIKNRIAIKTKFKINDGSVAEYLKEKEKYYRGY